MSSRQHECPVCGRQWSCDGCYTREVERECDVCLRKPTTTLQALQAARKELLDEGSPIVATIRQLRARVAELEAENAALQAPGSYCPKCGSCGETGCCGVPRCAYLDAHQGDYDALAKDNARLERDLLEANCRTDRLREALEVIAKTKYLGGSVPNEINDIARAALSTGEGK